MSTADLWARLSAGKLVEGDRPQDHKPASPWYVRAMLGIAGWIAAAFLLMFIGAAFSVIMDEAVYAALLGAACCAAAYGLFRAFDGNDFAEQFALVVSLVGQVLIVIGIAEVLEMKDPALYLSIAAAEALLVLLIPNFLHRVLASAGAAVAIALAINRLSLHGLAAPLLCAGLAWVWLDPKRWAVNGALWRPVGYGLVLALLLVETFRLFDPDWLLGTPGERRSWIALHGPLVGRALNAAILVWVAIALARGEGFRPDSRVALAAAGSALVIGLFGLGAPGLVSALLILLLGFAAGNRLLMALGVLSLLGFVSHYYYSLHATLLEKSGLLAATGLVLLAAWFVLRRGLASAAPAEASHA
jgi:uncharacterized membrane protein